MGRVNYMRKSFDSLTDYPPPHDGETVLDWVDRLHSQNISIARMDILDWFWYSVALNLNYEEKEALLASHPDIKCLAWAGRVYLSSADDLMFLKLCAGSDVVHSPMTPYRLKEENESI